MQGFLEYMQTPLHTFIALHCIGLKRVSYDFKIDIEGMRVH